MSRDIRQELKLLAESLRAEDFKPLSSGIGLGVGVATKEAHAQASELRPQGEVAYSGGDPLRALAVAGQPLAKTTLSSSAIKPAAAAPLSPLVDGQNHAPSFWGKSRRRVMALLLDILFLGSSLMAVTFAYFFCLKWPEQNQPSTWLSLYKAWLLQLPRYEMGGGLLAIVFFYGLLFRLWVGVTLGEALIATPKSRGLTLAEEKQAAS